MKKNEVEKIRIISGTVNGDRFAVAELEGNIQVWDLRNGFISTFSTDIVSAMRNAISISEDGKQLVVAGYDHNSVTLYDTENGKIVWQIKSIKKPSTVIILNYYRNLIYVNTENQGSFLLDRKTGHTVEKLNGIKFIRESPYSNICQFEKSTKSIIVNRVDGESITSFTHKSFAMLDAAFSKDKIISSYSGNPLEAISLTTFETCWTTSVIGHLLKVEYSLSLNKILGIRWEYQKGSPKYLCYIHVDTGKIEKEINLGEPVTVMFLKKGSILLTSQGNLYSTSTGEQIKKFDFE